MSDISKINVGSIEYQVKDSTARTNIETLNIEMTDYVNEQVKKAAHRNLLDNSDFRNPVNQRGQMNYENLSYQFFVDRWKGNNVSYNVGTRIVTVTNSSNGKFYQYVPTDKVTYGKKVTFAVCINGEVFTVNGTFGEYVETANKYSILKIWGGSSSDEAFAFEINFQGQSVGYAVEIDWAALYEGEYTAETLPEYQPKGYGVELAECMRYYYRNYYGEMPQAGFASLYAPLSGRTISVMFPTPMRVTPTITLYNPITGHSGCVANWATDADVIANVVYSNEHNFIVGGDMTEGQMIAYNYEASADL